MRLINDYGVNLFISNSRSLHIRSHVIMKYFYLKETWVHSFSCLIVIGKDL